MNKDHRKLWRPKRPEIPEQCLSCPFREGNDAEFGAVLNKLRAASGIAGKSTTCDIAFARQGVRDDLSHSGDFVCHGTAYTPDMKPKPKEEWRQCPGATKFFKGEIS